MKTMLKILISFMFIAPLLAHGKIMGKYYHINGVTIYTETIGNGEPIVILHGGPGLDHTYLRPQLEELAKHFQLIFYDQRGSGKSSGIIDSASINTNNFVEDLEGLRKKLNLSQMNLLGHSWGSFLAMKYALKYPRRIKKLILVGSFGVSSKFLNEFVKNREARRTKDDSLALKKIMSSDGFAKRAPPTMNQFARLFFKSYFYDQSRYNQLTLTFNENTARNILPIFTLLSKEFSSYDIRKELKKFDFPVLIVHGNNDLIPVNYAHELNETITNSKLVVINNCGHFPFIEAENEFNNACANFLK